MKQKLTRDEREAIQKTQLTDTRGSFIIFGWKVLTISKNLGVENFSKVMHKWAEGFFLTIKPSPPPHPKSTISKLTTAFSASPSPQNNRALIHPPSFTHALEFPPPRGGWNAASPKRNHFAPQEKAKRSCWGFPRPISIRLEQKKQQKTRRVCRFGDDS